MAEPRVTKHQVVHITYQITDQSGSILECIDLPVGYVHGGKSDLFPQVEERLDGCAVGDMVDVTLPPQDAFGYPDPSLTFTDAIDNVPPQYRRPGAEATFQNERGETITMTVVGAKEGAATLDGNHPLAGKTITFHVTAADIRDATRDEIANGVPEGSLPVH
ncbi:MAG: peptidylprolyl isomerase [Gammaproteobacteria bacterium]|nr:peptidylprolyl isomerase [Gammaproteobacteria bacterium]